MKADAVDGSVTFPSSQYEKMKELVEINAQLKKLETKKKDLVDEVKGYMVNSKIMDVDVNGTCISVTESQRRTVTSKTKDEFIAQLASIGKKHLIKTEITPDVDSIFAEVEAGTIDKNLVDKYVKVTEVLTLKCV